MQNFYIVVAQVQEEIASFPSIEPTTILEEPQRKQLGPTESNKYSVMQATSCNDIWELHKVLTNFDQKQRTVTMMLLMKSCYQNAIKVFNSTQMLNSCCFSSSHIEKDMRNGMLLGKRRQAGLHDDFFYNNPNESVHFRFKNKLRQEKSLKETSGKPAKKCTLSDAVDIYKGMLEEYNRNAERAILGIGPYELAPELTKFYVPPNRWSQFSEDVRRQKIALYHNAKITLPLESRCLSSHVSQPPENNSCQSEHDFNLSNYPPISQETPLNDKDKKLIDFDHSGLPENFRTDWRGAVSIITDKAAMKTPWTDQSYIVRSDSNPKEPHPVTFSRSKNTVSCNCHRYKYGQAENTELSETSEMSEMSETSEKISEMSETSEEISEKISEMSEMSEKISE